SLPAIAEALSPLYFEISQDPRIDAQLNMAINIRLCHGIHPMIRFCWLGWKYQLAAAIFFGVKCIWGQ
ncbi:hypothetical protein RZS08_06945, partial [Arthrospira platensis SPKY1]|nr:hypothetical protein [Arthrospira platensis SPKY1]